jgi:hypothetical protein
MPGAGSQLTGCSVLLRARGLDFSRSALGSCGRRTSSNARGQALTGTQDNDEIIERVAALDIGKADLVCCVRVPDEDHRGKRLQEVETYSAMTRSLRDGRSSGVPRGDPGGHGGHQRLLETGVLPAGSGRVRDLAGQRQGRQAPAGAAEDRQAGRGLAGQGRRAPRPRQAARAA